MAPSAPNPRRRPCYANSRLLQLPQLRSARPRWRPPPPPPGAAGTVAGMAAAGIVAGAGAVPASMSAAPPIMATAAVTSADWSRRHGAPAGGWSIAATDLPSFDLEKPRRPAAPGLLLFCPDAFGPDAAPVPVHAIFTKGHAIRPRQET